MRNLQIFVVALLALSALTGTCALLNEDFLDRRDSSDTTPDSTEPDSSARQERLFDNLSRFAQFQDHSFEHHREAEGNPTAVNHLLRRRDFIHNKENHSNNQERFNDEDRPGKASPPMILHVSPNGRPIEGANGKALHGIFGMLHKMFMARKKINVTGSIHYKPSFAFQPVPAPWQLTIMIKSDELPDILKSVTYKSSITADIPPTTYSLQVPKSLFLNFKKLRISALWSTMSFVGPQTMYGIENPKESEVLELKKPNDTIIHFDIHLKRYKIEKHVE